MLMRLLISLLLLGASGCSLATSATTTQTPAQIIPKQTVSLKLANKMKNLDSDQCKNRLLLVFAPSKNNADYQQQMQLFQGQQVGFEERNLLVIELLGQTAMAADFRQFYNVSPEEFRIVLVGKDGTEKRRDNSPVSPKVIFETIDAMPMRQQEMRRGSN